MKKQVIKFNPRESWIARGNDGKVRMYKHFPQDTNETRCTMILTEEQVAELDIEITTTPVKCIWHRAIEVIPELDITTL